MTSLLSSATADEVTVRPLRVAPSDHSNWIKAAMNVNVWDVIDEVKPLIVDETAVDPARLSDPSVAYSELAARR